ncbi:MAG: DnaD domain protein [Clostridia bacterium]|nr:DnaD domain protein [Clostridia bacterium]
MKLNFGREVLVLPGAALSCCDNADAAYLRVLLWLSSDLSLAQKPKQLAKLVGCDAKTLKAAFAFWSENGVLCGDEEEPSIPVMAAAEEKVSEKKADKEPEKHLHRADELPNYTSTELADLMEQRAGVRVLVDEAQRILGKIFNMSEVNILVGMLDYLGMSEECVLMLLAHCARIKKKSLRTIEKYAILLVDAGINTPAALEEEFRIVETVRSFEGQIRSMFGMQARSLTAKEEVFLRDWISYGYDVEIIRLAYEITVNAINQPSLPYTNSILKGWHEEGLDTLEKIQTKLAEDKAQKDGNLDRDGRSILGNSFDTDDLFEAALKRSMIERREN